MRATAFVCLLLVSGLAGGTLAQAQTSKIFKAAGDFLGYAPRATDTVFVPTDAAMAAFMKRWAIEKAGDLENPMYTDLLTRVAAGHLYEKGSLKAAQLTNGQQLTMMDGSKVTVVKAPNGAVELRGPTNTAKVVAADKADGPATVHLIDAVLLPKNVYPSLYDAAAARKDLSILKSYLDRSPKAKAKAANPRFGGTYFAANDAGFRQVATQDKVAVDAVLGTTKDEAGLELLYAGVATPYGFEQLRKLPEKAPLQSVVRVGGVPVPIFHQNNGSTVNVWGDLNLKDRATIVDKDILIGAGVMHVVDLPLLADVDVAATQSVLTALQKTPELSLFYKLTQATGIADELGSPAFFGTLFAPTNKAVEDFSAKMGFKSVDDMLKVEPLVDAILGYQLLPVAYPGSRLKDYAPFSVKPFKGGVLRFSGDKAGGKVTVVGEHNSATVTRAGIDAGRAVVHVTDNVLLPENVFYTLADALAYFPTVSILQNLISMTPALAKPAADAKTAVTVFAPRNEAFTARSAGSTLVDGLEEDAATRLAGLEYHVVPGARYVPRGFKDGETLQTMLKGQDLTVKLGVKKVDGKEVGTLALNTTGGSDVDVVVVNIIAGQSVVHGVDRLLVPKSFGPPAAAPAKAGAGRH